MNTSKNIHIGADHGGFELKEKIKVWLEDLGYGVKDFGAYSLVPEDDYPAFAIDLAREVVAGVSTNTEIENKNPVGILFCRSGGGMVIAANKVKGARAVSVHDKKSAVHAKADNNANIISISADWTSEEQAKEIITAFLETKFSGAERHIKRINQITDFESSLQPQVEVV